MIFRIVIYVHVAVLILRTVQLKCRKVLYIFQRFVVSEAGWKKTYYIGCSCCTENVLSFVLSAYIALFRCHCACVSWLLYVLLTLRISEFCANKIENSARVTCKFCAPFSWILCTFCALFKPLFDFKIIGNIAVWPNFFRFWLHSLICFHVVLNELWKFGFQMIVNSGLAFVWQNNVAGATQQYSVILIQLSAGVRAILLNKIYKILQFLCHFVNSAHDGQFCAIRRVQNCRILTSVVNLTRGVESPRVRVLAWSH